MRWGEELNKLIRIKGLGGLQQMPGDRRRDCAAARPPAYRLSIVVDYDLTHDTAARVRFWGAMVDSMSRYGRKASAMERTSSN
jgi:hypothetical protein